MCIHKKAKIMQQPPNQPPFPGSNPNFPPQQPYYPNQGQPNYPNPQDQGQPNYPNPQANYYPQQPPMQPYGQYPPQQQQPLQQPKKKRTGCIVSAIVVIVVVIAIIAVSVSHSGGSSPTASTTTQSNTTQSNQSQSTSSSTHKVGDAVVIDGWTVTLNSAKTSSTGTVISQPKAGNQFLLVDVTVENNTGKSQPVSSLIQFALKDASGQGYNEALGSSDAKTPDGTLANGSKLRGTIGYEVPKSGSGFELDFTPTLGSTDQVVWNFSV